MQLFELAKHHRAWLGQRQAVVAQNIANANTPGYSAQAVADFSANLKEVSSTSMIATDRRHLQLSATSLSGGEINVADAETAAVTSSGNSVDVDAELLTAGATRSDFAINVSVIKTFNRMLQLSVRS